MLTREENELATRTGPGTPGGEMWRRFWVPAMLVTELPEPDCPPVRLRLLGEDLIAFRATDGRIGLVAGNCPHRGASLFFGRNQEQGLRCVYHGWKFDLEGHCVDMPNEPAESNPSAELGTSPSTLLRTGFKGKVHVTAYPCVERGGMVWTYMGPRDRTPPLPDLEFNLVEEPHRYVAKIQVDCNWLQALEGDIDNSHASFLHAMLGGTPDMPFLERLRLGGGILPQARARNPLARYFAYDTAPRGIVQETDNGIVMGWRRNIDDEDKFFWHINVWMLPSFALIAGAPGNTLQCNARVPRDDNTSWFFRIRWNANQPLSDQEVNMYKGGGGVFPKLIPGTFRPEENMENDYLIDRQAQRETSVTGIQSVPQQDRAVTETMGPIYDRTKEHLGTSDVVIIQMRRRVLREINALMQGREPLAPFLPETYLRRPVSVLMSKETPFIEGAREHMVPAGR